MRPLGTVRSTLLVLLAALCAAGGALEEKKGKGVSHRPAPPASALAQPQPPLRSGLCVPSRPLLLFWPPKAAGTLRGTGRFVSGMGETRAAEGRETGLGAEGLPEQRGSRGCALPGALDCCQVSCLTFLRSVGVWSRNVVRDSAGQRGTPGIGTRAPSTVRESGGTPDPQAGRAGPTRTVWESRDWSKNQSASGQGRDL